MLYADVLLLLLLMLRHSQQPCTHPDTMGIAGQHQTARQWRQRWGYKALPTLQRRSPSGYVLAAQIVTRWQGAAVLCLSCGGERCEMAAQMQVIQNSLHVIVLLYVCSYLTHIRKAAAEHRYMTLNCNRAYARRQATALWLTALPLRSMSLTTGGCWGHNMICGALTTDAGRTAICGSRRLLSSAHSTLPSITRFTHFCAVFCVQAQNINPCAPHVPTHARAPGVQAVRAEAARRLLCRMPRPCFRTQTHMQVKSRACWPLSHA